MGSEKEKDEMPIGIDEFLEITDGDYPIEPSEELILYIKSRTGLEKEIIQAVVKQLLLAMRYLLIKQKIVRIPQLCNFTLVKMFCVKQTTFTRKLKKKRLDAINRNSS